MTLHHALWWVTRSVTSASHLKYISSSSSYLSDYYYYHLLFQFTTFPVYSVFSCTCIEIEICMRKYSQVAKHKVNKAMSYEGAFFMTFSEMRNTCTSRLFQTWAFIIYHHINIIRLNVIQVEVWSVNFANSIYFLNIFISHKLHELLISCGMWFCKEMFSSKNCNLIWFCLCLCNLY